MEKLKVLNFTKLRFVFIAVSLLLIATGIAGIFINDGFNLGIDFTSGVNQRVQIAPVAGTVTYNGPGFAIVNIFGNELTVKVNTSAGEYDYKYSFDEYPAMKSLIDNTAEIEGFRLTAVDDTLQTANLLSLNSATEIGDQGVVLNYDPAVSDMTVTIQDIRTALSDLDAPEVQTAGADEQQEFMIVVQDDGTDPDFSENMSAKIISLLADEYGADSVIDTETQYIGPRLSQTLFKSTVSLGIIALLLILLYIWFRFKLAYAISAIVALLHDVTIMFGVIAVFRLELSTATIAAILTIIGYSLNDTIVVFDRVRENMKLMTDTDVKTVINTSITQSLSRTLITSLTTMLAVVALYIFATGTIQLFALNMIIGVVVGTYSSIFIASPVFLGFTNAAAKRKAKRDEEKFGAVAAAKKIADPSASATESNIVAIPKIERKKKGKRKDK